jgi:hypothetical protein
MTDATCSGSPFVFQEVTDEYTYNENMTVSGSATIPQYNISTTVCDICWSTGWCSNCCEYQTCVPWCCCWNYTGPGFCGTTSWSWCDCSTIESEIFPAINISASATMPLEFIMEAGYQITMDAPPEPYAATSVTAESFTCTLTIDGTPVTLTIPGGITITENSSGELSASMPLYTFKYAGVYDTVTIVFTIVFCMNAETWLMLNLNITIEPNVNTSYKDNFSFNVPLTDVE